MATEADIRVEAQFPYSYFEADGTEITFDEGERFILLKKSTEEWWKVERIDPSAKSKKKIIFVPATYVKEVTGDDSQISRPDSRADSSGSNPEYVNLDVFRETMMRNNSATDSEYSYSDQDTASSLGTSPRVLNGSFSPSGMQTFGDRKSMNLEAVLGEMVAKQAKRSDSVQSSGDNREIPEEIPESKSSNSQVKLRDNKNVDIPIGRRASTLPAGWQKITDDSSGRQFYYNEVTKESVWKPPRISVLLEGKQSSKGVPAGWIVEKDESNEDIYVNSSNEDKWKACKTEKGQTYYYKIGDDVTAWELPEVEVRFRGARRRSLDDLTDDKLTNRLTSTFPRNSKCKSVLFDFSTSTLKKQKEIDLESPKASPKILHRRSQSASTLLDSNDSETPGIRLPLSTGRARIPEVEGYLTRKKLVEAGKSKKFHWEQVYVCKYDNILVFYKDKKSATPKPDFPDGKPESSIDLRGAVLEPPNSEKTKGKKNVFQISTYNHATVMMLMADTPPAMASWLTPIHSTIMKLEENDPLPTMATLGRADSGASENISNSLSPTSKNPPATPTTPNFTRKEKIDRAERSMKGISRRLSKRGSTLNEEDANKTKIKDKLKKFLPKRPTYYELEKKGIIKQEIFGCDLQKLCQRENTTVPKFVVTCIEAVEKRGLKVRGIYRECGNASQMHKLRILTDQGEHVDFNDKQWADVHVIAGALKWYFRELPDPLIPTAAYNDFINAIKNPSVHERRRKFTSLISNLPSVNQTTLKTILQHLLKVSEFSAENKMEKHNCSIVFGPTLMKPADENDHLNIALNTVYQNQIVNFLLAEYSQIYTAQ